MQQCFLLSDFNCKHLCVKKIHKNNILNACESKKGYNKIITLLNTNRLAYFHFMPKKGDYFWLIKKNHDQAYYLNYCRQNDQGYTSKKKKNLTF